MGERDPFPRRKARTRGFTLGQPRSFAVAPDGSRVAFLRSPAGDDPTNALWVLDVDRAGERLVLDPRELGAAEADLPEAERARRERARERAGGVTVFACDLALRIAALALGGRLFVADLVAGGGREVPVEGPCLDPRPDPGGAKVAYVRDRELRVVDLASGEDRPLAGEDDPAVTWGLAEFVAAEEMGRHAGHWWAPDGRAVAAARVDERAVPVWHIADPVDPWRAPRAVRYPAAGDPNADVSLHVLGLDGSRVEVAWDREAFPYLVRVVWEEGSPLTLVVQSRDQRRILVLAADPATGATRVLREDVSPTWVEIVEGVPRWLAGGLVWTVEDVDADGRRLLVGGEVRTPPELRLRRVAGVAGGRVVIQASEAGEPTEAHVYAAGAEGVERLSRGPGLHDAPAAGGDVVVLVSQGPEDELPVARVLRGSEVVATVGSNAERPGSLAAPRLARSRGRGIPYALLLPEERGEGPLPVLLDPYGGPHLQRVWRASFPFLESRWFAEQGFAVLVADGRGTPAGGLAWEKAVHLDLIGPAVEDQVEALRDAADRHPGLLDLSRVAIRGWSFGGYLAAACVLRRPDVFHAAVAGAPVTDPALYDTHYTERYLGSPQEHPEAYARSSLLPEAGRLERPLLLIHGMADDNVYVAHTLRLSRALLEAGRPHAVLPLSGVTHMTPQEVVAENLLLLQLDFLRRALRLAEATSEPAP
ncbi:MAG TPA: prolyl oligopeptidase family serine peptidase [Actinomycetota bacterium]|nr:prolyl oligopeptidase family serine peptidase [Actinomycetota bacterium]